MTTVELIGFLLSPDEALDRRRQKNREYLQRCRQRIQDGVLLVPVEISTREIDGMVSQGHISPKAADSPQTLKGEVARVLSDLSKQTFAV